MRRSFVLRRIHAMRWRLAPCFFLLSAVDNPVEKL